VYHAFLCRRSYRSSAGRRLRQGDTYPNSNCYTYSDTCTHCDSHSDSHAHTNCYTDFDTHTHGDTDTGRGVPPAGCDGEDALKVG
jgi:hypothetical protein